MNVVVIKISFYLVFMIALIITAFITNDVISELFASLSIITGGFCINLLANLKSKKIN